MRLRYPIYHPAGCQATTIIPYGGGMGSRPVPRTDSVRWSAGAKLRFMTSGVAQISETALYWQTCNTRNLMLYITDD